MLEQKLMERATNTHARALGKSAAHFARVSGPDLIRRTEAYARWVEARVEADVWPFTRCLVEAPRARTVVRNARGAEVEGINFGSVDYLGLATHPAVVDAVVRTAREFGTHSANSGILMGDSAVSRQLERELVEFLGMEHVVLFPSGWAAGFAALVGLVRAEDHVLLDNRAHASLQQGAHAATQNIHFYHHVDTDSLRERLQALRATDTRNGILVVTEGLFSMDSDWPDIRAVQQLCREYQATLLIDVAHDLGAMGRCGGGQLEVQGMVGQADLVMGAFSKAFASNGGFLATNAASVAQFVKAYGPSYTFTTALSPVQAASALASLRIVDSAEGAALRERTLETACALREELLLDGIRCLGGPSAIVMAPVGLEKIGRVASTLLFEKSVFANLIEFPAVAVGSSRFRLQVMATHTEEQARLAARAVGEAVREARAIVCGEAAAEPDTAVAVVRKREE